MDQFFDSYDLKLVGDGSQSQVFEAVLKTDPNEKIALKSSWIPVAREREMLDICKDEFVIRAFDTIVTESEQVLVMECAEFSLFDLLRSNVELSRANKMRLIWMLFRGAYAVHSHNIVHSDIAPGNMIVTKSGHMKLTDFAGAFELGNDHGIELGTLNYRSPESLFGCNQRTFASDIWGCGCVAFEIFTGKPLFRANGSVPLVGDLVDMFGPLSVQEWPGIASLPDWGKLTFPGSLWTLEQRKLSLVEKFPSLSIEDANFFLSILQYNADFRPTAKIVLDHEWFASMDEKVRIDPTLPKSVIDEINNVVQESRVSQMSSKNSLDSFLVSIVHDGDGDGDDGIEDENEKYLEPKFGIDRWSNFVDDM